jgi:hypothetical protein
MFVRGLQASYNQVSAKTGYKVPFGSMIVFGLSCGQIMFAFLLSPSTIPPEYNSWYVSFAVDLMGSWTLTGEGNRIQSASRVQKSAIQANYSVVRDNAVNVEALKQALKHKVSLSCDVVSMSFADHVSVDAERHGTQRFYTTELD